jgi:3-hydroxybutyryl-CoA dehydratase
MEHILVSGISGGRDGLRYEDLAVGQTAEIVTDRPVTNGDIEAVGRVFGDWNPLHFDATYAASTPLKRIAVHGVLGVGYMSALIGNHLPGGGAVLLGIDEVKFPLPLRPGSFVNTVARITELELILDEQNRETDNGKVVLYGTCLVRNRVFMSGKITIAVRRSRRSP